MKTGAEQALSSLLKKEIDKVAVRKAEGRSNMFRMRMIQVQAAVCLL